MTNAFEIIDTWATVYKYRALDRNTVSIFVDRELYFAPPSQLNDPHDCQIDLPAALRDAINSFDVMSAPDNVAPALRTAREQLNTDADKISNRLEEAKRQYAVCSMSAVSGDPLMWAHYGDEHRGLCIGFNPRLVRERSGGFDLVLPMPVYYSDENPMVICIKQFTGLASTHYSSTGEGPSVDVLYTLAVNAAIAAKSLAWAYEKEFRFVRNGSGSVKFETDAMVEVILGYRMSKRDRQTVLNLLKAPEWSHVLIREVVKQAHKPTFTIQNLR